MNFTILHKGKEPKVGSDYYIAGVKMKVKSVNRLNKKKFQVMLIEPKTGNQEEKRWLIKKKAVKS